MSIKLKKKVCGDCNNYSKIYSACLLTKIPGDKSTEDTHKSTDTCAEWVDIKLIGSELIGSFFMDDR